MNKFLLVGSDPEAFLRDSHNELVSAIGVIPGTKTDPYKTLNGFVQHDNILAEFNSKPASTLLEFITNHNLVIQDLNDIIKPLNLHLDFVASAIASDVLLSDPISRIAGCEPDYDAWLLSRNMPTSYNGINMRAAGGHVHISFDQATLPNLLGRDARLNFVKALDLVLGVPSILYDEDTARRQYYGKAGSFRPKITTKKHPDPYDGIEYRTLSNFWLKSEETMAFIWNGVERVYNNLEELSQLSSTYKDRVIDIINNSNVKDASLLCKELSLI